MKGILLLLVYQAIGLFFEFARLWDSFELTYGANTADWEAGAFIDLAIFMGLSLTTLAAAVLLAFGAKLGLRLAQVSLSALLAVFLIGNGLELPAGSAIARALFQLALLLFGLRYLFFSPEVRQALSSENRSG